MLSTDTVIQHEYRYSDVYGIHTINVRGFNLANNDTASATVDVLEWQCERPNVSIDPVFTVQDIPFVALPEDGFTIHANFTVACMKKEQFNALWEVLDSDDQSVVTSLANGSKYVSVPNALLPGAYVIRINVTIWSSFFNLSDKTVIAYAYVNVERCQSPNVTVNSLFADEDRPYTGLIENGFTVTIDYAFECAKLEQFNIQWDILDSTQHSVSTVPNATELISLPNTLPVGSYVIRINVTMRSSFFDLSDKMVIKYAYVNIEDCHPLNITLMPPVTHSGKPLVVLDKDGFAVTADLSVDCPIMEQITAQWDVLDYSKQTVLRTLPNATRLVILPYDLPVGFYTIRLNVTISGGYFDEFEKNTISFTYVNVTRSFLTTGIDGSSYINVIFNSTIYLSAYNLTRANNKPASDKTGMDFEWRCKRANETWPIQLPTQPYLPHNGTNGGCFGIVGPGILGFAAGLWNFTIDTGYLEPMVEYNIQFVVWKETHSANTSVSLYVQQPLAPIMSIRQV